MTTTDLIASLRPLAASARQADDANVAAAGTVLTALLTGMVDDPNGPYLNALAVVAGILARFPKAGNAEILLLKLRLEEALYDLETVASVRRHRNNRH